MIKSNKDYPKYLEIVQTISDAAETAGRISAPVQIFARRSNWFSPVKLGWRIPTNGHCADEIPIIATWTLSPQWQSTDCTKQYIISETMKDVINWFKSGCPVMEEERS